MQPLVFQAGRTPNLFLPGLETDLVTELEHACQCIVEHGHAIFTQSEVEHHHLAFEVLRMMKTEQSWWTSSKTGSDVRLVGLPKQFSLQEGAS